MINIKYNERISFMLQVRINTILLEHVKFIYCIIVFSLLNEAVFIIYIPYSTRLLNLKCIHAVSIKVIFLVHGKI